LPRAQPFPASSQARPAESPSAGQPRLRRRQSPTSPVGYCVGDADRLNGPLDRCATSELRTTSLPFARPVSQLPVLRVHRRAERTLNQSQAAPDRRPQAAEPGCTDRD
jgi:hypothetical protein